MAGSLVLNPSGMSSGGGMGTVDPRWQRLHSVLYLIDWHLFDDRGHSLFMGLSAYPHRRRDNSGNSEIPATRFPLAPSGMLCSDTAGIPPSQKAKGGAEEQS